MVTQSLPQLRYEDYHVGWICALPLELAAAASLLDEEHAAIAQSYHDKNLYKLGRMGSHNIVMVCLPLGRIGTAFAAQAACHMRRTFPSIEIGLLVGISGGAPSEAHDIRLGDVVVSKPERAKSGVIQYDFGATIDYGRFEIRGSLNSPPEALLNAVGNLAAKHSYQEMAIPDILEESIKKWPKRRKACTAPSPEEDFLFKAEYQHPDSTVPHCGRCDKSQLIQRDPRDEALVVHYGVIATADQVMRDGRTRERLRKEHNVLCFETEASGVMNVFPCIVIRGICDYADSHKTKRWQDYSAATAAAYAKELLSVLPEEDMNQPTPPVFTGQGIATDLQPGTTVESVHDKVIEHLQQEIKQLKMDLEVHRATQTASSRKMTDKLLAPARPPPDVPSPYPASEFETPDTESLRPASPPLHVEDLSLQPSETESIYANSTLRDRTAGPDEKDVQDDRKASTTSVRSDSIVDEPHNGVNPVMMHGCEVDEHEQEIAAQLAEGSASGSESRPIPPLPQPKSRRRLLNFTGRKSNKPPTHYEPRKMPEELSEDPFPISSLNRRSTELPDYETSESRLEASTKAFERTLMQTVLDLKLVLFYPPDSSLLEDIAAAVVHNERNTNWPNPAQELARELSSSPSFFTLYDLAVFVDDSGSMLFEEESMRIPQLREVLERILFCAQHLQPEYDGFEIRFMNTPGTLKRVITPMDLASVMAGHRYSGLTPVGHEVKNKIMEPIFLKGLDKRTKPLMLFIITDGQPAGEPKDMLERVLRHAENAAALSKYGSGALHVQMIQVGNDLGANDFLHDLTTRMRMHAPCHAPSLAPWSG